jgi:acyl transferase domain-containing protein
VIAGCNLLFAPDLWLLLDGINVLSPDGISHSFDSRANGYARGEGFAVVIAKRLSDALRNNDTIRAVVRSTSSNQNGHMRSGITQTSETAQESLMRVTYQKANLDMSITRYVEAHATGTKFGQHTKIIVKKIHTNQF